MGNALLLATVVAALMIGWASLVAHLYGEYRRLFPVSCWRLREARRAAEAVPSCVGNWMSLKALADTGSAGGPGTCHGRSVCG